MKNLNSTERSQLEPNSVIYLPVKKVYYRVLHAAATGALIVYDNGLRSINLNEMVLVPVSEEEIVIAELSL